MWESLPKDEFERFLSEEALRLDDNDRRTYDLFMIPTTAGIIRRSETAGDEVVYVVAKSPIGALYFDDVESGFNFSPLDNSGRILQPGGSQLDLRDAVRTWLAPQSDTSAPIRKP